MGEKGNVPNSNTSGKASFLRSLSSDRGILKRSDSGKSRQRHSELAASSQNSQKQTVIEKIRSKFPIISEAAVNDSYSSEEFHEAVLELHQGYNQICKDSSAKREEIQREIAEVVQKSGMVIHLVKIFEKCLDKGLVLRFHISGKPMKEVICSSLSILAIIQNFTYCSQSFCEAAVENTNLLVTIYEFLHEVEEEFINDTRNEVIKKLVESCININYNIVKHDQVDLNDCMRTNNLFTGMQPYLKASNVRLRMCVLMFFAYLVNEDEAEKYCNDDESLQLILKNLEQAMNDKNKLSNGLQFLDILRVVTKLASLDVCKKKIGDIAVMRLMEQIITSGECGEAELTSKVLARLAFDSEIAKRIKEIKLDDLIQRRSDHFRSSMMRRVSIKMQKVMDPKRDSRAPSEGNSQKHIMISYSNKWYELVVRIKDAIEKKGYKIWFDDDKMKYYGNTLDGMSDAIEESWLVIICTSRHYKNSVNCRLEAENAHSKMKEIIYLKLDNYKPDGWLGLLMGCRYHYNFSGNAPFEKVCGNLLERIEQLYGKYEVEVKQTKTRSESEAPLSSLTEEPIEVEPSESNPVREWDNDRVKQWCDEKGIPWSGQIESFTGRELLFLAELQRHKRDAFFDMVTKLDFSLVTDITKLSSALDEL